MTHENEKPNVVTPFNGERASRKHNCKEEKEKKRNSEEGERRNNGENTFGKGNAEGTCKLKHDHDC